MPSVTVGSLLKLKAAGKRWGGLAYLKKWDGAGGYVGHLPDAWDLPTYKGVAHMFGR